MIPCLQYLLMYWSKSIWISPSKTVSLSPPPLSKDFLPPPLLDNISIALVNLYRHAYCVKFLPSVEYRAIPKDFTLTHSMHCSHSLHIQLNWFQFQSTQRWYQKKLDWWEICKWETCEFCLWGLWFAVRNLQTIINSQFSLKWIWMCIISFCEQTLKIM